MDRSLDEIIAEEPRKQNRPSGGRRNQGQGQGRRRDRGDGIRKPQSQDRVDLNLDWVHDKYEDDREGRPSRNSRRSRRSTSPGGRGSSSMLTKVRVENLHYDITESDLEDLFGRIGPVTDLSLVYDRAGRSEGVAYVTYKHLNDAHKSLKEYDGANAKGHPIRLSLVPGRREQQKSLFDRVARPSGRDARSLSPGGEDGSGRGRRGRGRRNDTRAAPGNIDRYVPGEQSPNRRGGAGGRRGGGGRDNGPRTENGGRRSGNARPRKTQEELDQEMEDYWGGNAGGEGAENQAAQEQQAAPAETAAPVAEAAAPAAAAPAHNDDDIDMIE
ncbi:RNA-binding domain-containing protein [Penicillium angulare]|uniref:RNA-binding domain-containing protein n=1 Tax=Penicillium angulare TaxID=116970 RepID=UPI0025425FE3|nr:RNA-binding domain-containing protein [Penicillium angulare]KAJ5280168.1 RNA-binding domain-containing protein [Penicillium angulare]